MSEEKKVELTANKSPREFLSEYFGCGPSDNIDAEKPDEYIEITVKVKEE